MKDMIGYCGLDCEKCDAYLATIHNDQALREKTAKKWSEMNHVEILPEYINCEGCRVNGVKTYFCEQMCGIRKCAAAKGFMVPDDRRGPSWKHHWGLCGWRLAQQPPCSLAWTAHFYLCPWLVWEKTSRTRGWGKGDKAASGTDESEEASFVSPAVSLTLVADPLGSKQSWGRG